MSVATSKTLLSASTSTGAGSVVARAPAIKTFHLTGTTTAGAGAATVYVQVSNDNANWITAATLSLTLGTTATSDGCVIDAPWTFIRGNVNAISGTGASVSLHMGYVE